MQLKYLFPKCSEHKHGAAILDTPFGVSIESLCEEQLIVKLYYVGFSLKQKEQCVESYKANLSQSSLVTR